MGVPKFPKLGLLQLWRPITLCVDLWLRWGPKQSYSLYWKFFNGMCQATCTKGGQGDSWLLVVESQIGKLTPDPSLGHNLCFTYRNGSCEPFWTSKFQDIFNDINNSSIQWVLTPEITLWRFRSPSGLQLPKWELTWECGGSFLHILPHSHTPGSMKCDS